MPGSHVDLELFMQIDPEKYQSSPPLLEVVPGAQSDSSVHQSTALFFCLLIQLLRLNLINIFLIYEQVLRAVAALMGAEQLPRV